MFSKSVDAVTGVGRNVKDFPKGDLPFCLEGPISAQGRDLLVIALDISPSTLTISMQFYHPGSAVRQASLDQPQPDASSRNLCSPQGRRSKRADGFEGAADNQP